MSDGDFATLSVRARNIFAREGVRTIDDLCNLTSRELLDFRNMGVYTLKEIDTFLNSRGRSLGDSARKTANDALRDYFAAAACASLAKEVWGHLGQDETDADIEDVALLSYQIADAMMERRAKAAAREASA